MSPRTGSPSRPPPAKTPLSSATRFAVTSSGRRRCLMMTHGPDTSRSRWSIMTCARPLASFATAMDEPTPTPCSVVCSANPRSTCCPIWRPRPLRCEPLLSCKPRPSSCPAGRTHSKTARPRRPSLLPQSGGSIDLLTRLWTGKRRPIRQQEAPMCHRSYCVVRQPAVRVHQCPRRRSLLFSHRRHRGRRLARCSPRWTMENVRFRRIRDSSTGSRSQV